MKKWIIILMASGMVLASGCGNSEKVIEGNVQNIVTGGENAQSEETGNVQESQKEDAVEDNGGNSRGYTFTFNGVAVEMDADAAPVIGKLGEPVSYFEAQSCAFEGLDKIYTYNGFEIDTYPVKDTDCISAVIFKDDSVMTAEGVGIGDTKEKLEQVYGNEGTREDGMLVYGKDGMKLCFILKDDEIISVEYRSTVLD